MRVQKKNKAFAYRVPIGDYNYLQCRLPTEDSLKRVRETKVRNFYLEEMMTDKFLLPKKSMSTTTCTHDRAIIIMPSSGRV